MKIHQEVTYPVAPGAIYELLTNGAKFGTVTGHPGKGGGVPGAMFSLFNEWIEGRQIELVPNERIVQAWRMQNWEPGVYSLVRFTLTPEGTGTKLLLDHEGYPETFHEHISTNWSPFYFEPFARHFAA